LDPTLPKEGVSKLERYRSKFGETRMAQMIPYMEGIAKNEGITGFYKGMSTRLASSVLNAAFLFLFKEEITALLINLLKVVRSK